MVFKILICEFADEIQLVSTGALTILTFVMPIADHLVRFRMKSTEDLLTLQTELEAQETIFNAQSQGSTSMQRDLRLLADKLNAIAYVLRERGVAPITPNPNQQTVGTTDFSNVII